MESRARLIATLRSIASSALNFRAFNVRVIDDRGMTTAEYAIGTVAAVAFAAVLYKVVRSQAVSDALAAIVQSALHAM